jgi:tetratricopeptide (TPR) repeat protein
VALGELSDATGLPDIAVREYRRAIDLDPRHAKALSLLAYRYIAFGWNKDASEILQRAIKEVPGDVRLRVSMGLLHFQNGDSGAAERELHEARRLSPDDPAILGPLIQVYQQASRYQDALATVDEAIQKTPGRAVLHLERAKILLKLRDYDGAVGAANEVLKLEPVSLHALYQRGAAYKMSGNATRAIIDLERVHAKEPRLDNTLLHLGNLYLQAGRVDEGKELLATFKRYRAISGHLARLTLGVANKGRDPESHYQLGEYYLKVGSYARAVVELKRALELNPKHPLVRPHLRTALHKMNRHPEAQAI